MGTIFQLPVVEIARAGTPLPADGAHGVTRPATSQTLVEALQQLRANGIHIIAAHPHTERQILSQTDFKRDCCIVFGSEGSGLSKSVLEVCDEAVAIPMADGVDSLNVGAAAAVFLYEAQRQRGH